MTKTQKFVLVVLAAVAVVSADVGLWLIAPQRDLALALGFIGFNAVVGLFVLWAYWSDMP